MEDADAFAGEERGGNSGFLKEKTSADEMGL